MKLFGKISFFLLIGSSFFLIGCKSSFPLEIASKDFDWKPKLKVEMQAIPYAQQELIYQELSDKQENLDTLIISSDNIVETSLSSYVQEQINQLKIQGFELSSEKMKKMQLAGRTSKYPALLKTYEIGNGELQLFMAQLFIQKDEHRIIMLSHASDEESHTKKFIKELSSLKLTF